MPFSEKLILAGFFLVLLALFVGLPALAGRLGWNKGPMRRSDYFRQLFGWGIVSMIGGGILGNAAGQWPVVLTGLVIILWAGWKVSRSGGSRLRDMRWPRWTVWFVAVPFFSVVLLFWPPNPRRDAPQATPA